MRAIQVTRFGPPGVLTLATLPDPTPAPGEVRVRVHAIGVNFSDTERRRAVFDPPELPWVPGREAAGVVDVVGEGVDPALAGARVAYYSRRRGGAYAELATVAVDELLHFPDSVPFATMAAVPVQGLTAWGLVHFVANVRAGDVVLLHAAAGGVGQLAVQLARRAGARVLGTVSTDEKAAIVRRLGAEPLRYGDEPLRYGDDLAERVRAATGGRGADVVLDSVGLATHGASLAAVATFGQVIFFGDASGPVPPIDVEALYAHSTRSAPSTSPSTTPPRDGPRPSAPSSTWSRPARCRSTSRAPCPSRRRRRRTTPSNRGRRPGSSCCCRSSRQGELLSACRRRRGPSRPPGPAAPP